MANLSELVKQREELERQIKQLQESSRTEAIATIRQLMVENGLTAQDLIGKPGTEKKPRGTVAAKYRDSASGKTWTGRGLKPKWVTEALESGKTLDDLVIRGDSAA